VIYATHSAFNFAFDLLDFWVERIDVNIWRVLGWMKKIKLSPVEREILWTLEEAGAENLSTLEATVKSVGKKHSKLVFSQSLENLKRKEFIEIETDKSEKNISVVLTEKGRNSLTI